MKATMGAAHMGTVPNAHMPSNLMANPHDKQVMWPNKWCSWHEGNLSGEVSSCLDIALKVCWEMLKSKTEATIATVLACFIDINSITCSCLVI